MGLRVRVRGRVRVRVRVSNLGELAAVVRLQDSGCSVDCEDVEKREGDGVVALGRERAVVVQLDACGLHTGRA